MHFAEIASRLTGISTPVFGVSWNPPQPDRVVAKRVLTFLEDRRVLYVPTDVEVAEHCVSSVLDIRRFLTQILTEESDGDFADHLRAMRAACRKFLGTVGFRDDTREFLLPHHRFYGNGLNDWALNQALGELRGVFGIHIAQLAVKYGLDVEDQLAAVLPVEPDDKEQE